MQVGVRRKTNIKTAHSIFGFIDFFSKVFLYITQQIWASKMAANDEKVSDATTFVDYFNCSTNT